jgi:hypothetical protein
MQGKLGLLTSFRADVSRNDSCCPYHTLSREVFVKARCVYIMASEMEDPKLCLHTLLYLDKHGI